MNDREFIAVFHYDNGGTNRCGAEPYRYAEEIVRCKDCKKRDTKACSLSWVTEWGEWEIGHCNNDEWYCGDAERREP